MNENEVAKKNRIVYNKGAEKVEGAWNVKSPCDRLIKAPFVYHIM